MTKKYIVLITAYAHVLVDGSKDEKEAMEAALDQCAIGDLQMDETSIYETLPDKVNMDGEIRKVDCYVPKSYFE